VIVDTLERMDGLLDRWEAAGDQRSVLLADVALGRVDEWLAVRLLRAWRTDVWRSSLRLLERGPGPRPHDLARCADRCERRGRWILLRA
jgi:hypothetical protein